MKLPFSKQTVFFVEKHVRSSIQKIPIDCAQLITVVLHTDGYSEETFKGAILYTSGYRNDEW